MEGAEVNRCKLEIVAHYDECTCPFCDSIEELVLPVSNITVVDENREHWAVRSSPLVFPMRFTARCQCGRDIPVVVKEKDRIFMGAGVGGERSWWGVEEGK